MPWRSTDRFAPGIERCRRLFDDDAQSVEPYPAFADGANSRRAEPETESNISKPLRVSTRSHLALMLRGMAKTESPSVCRCSALIPYDAPDDNRRLKHPDRQWVYGLYLLTMEAVAIHHIARYRPQQVQQAIMKIHVASPCVAVPFAKSPQRPVTLCPFVSPGFRRHPATISKTIQPKHLVQFCTKSRAEDPTTASLNELARRATSRMAGDRQRPRSRVRHG